MIKLLALDLDDTCLDRRNQISVNTMSALKEAFKRGVEIVFVTGRAYSVLPFQLGQEHFYRYVITSNGARIMDTQSNESLFCSQIDAETALSLLDAAKQYRLGLTAHIDNEYVIEGRFLYELGSIIYGKDSQKAIRVKNIREYVHNKGCDVEEIHLFFFTGTEKRGAEELIMEYPHLNGPLGPFYVEFVSKQTSKGAALEWLYSKLGLEKSEVACVGDGENDMTMFEKCGKRFAMGNANTSLKMIADEVVPSNDEDGVACAVDQILAKRL